MKDFLIGVVCAICLFVTMTFFVWVCVEGQNTMDKNLWNDGVCPCGGKWEFSNASAVHKQGNSYFYVCDDCGDVIELHSPQTK
jgi:transcription elongation factor Elf1